jgi:sulfotransferase family protein
MRRMNLFLVACPRAGSTQLARWLGSHPAICLSPIKEPNFFAAQEFDEDYVRSTHLNDVEPARYLARRRRPPVQFAVLRRAALYDALCEGMPGVWRLDASTSYLACPEAPAKIRAYNPAARILLLTREPLARALSHYRLAVRTGHTVRSLAAELTREQACETPLPGRFLLRPSLWQAGIARFHCEFPPEQILQLTFEAMIADPKAALARICRFLNLSPEGVNLSLEARNPGHAPRFSALNRRLYTSGAKTRLRRLLPQPLKSRLRHVWFSPSREIPVSIEENRFLCRALGVMP